MAVATSGPFSLAVEILEYLFLKFQDLRRLRVLYSHLDV
jgi:hypothetical protein